MGKQEYRRRYGLTGARTSKVFPWDNLETTMDSRYQQYCHSIPSGATRRPSLRDQAPKRHPPSVLWRSRGECSDASQLVEALLRDVAVSLCWKVARY